ncbi:MAG TPA: hypothetical protein VF039_04450 [Longimicrobiales bacterium]
MKGGHRAWLCALLVASATPVHAQEVERRAHRDPTSALLYEELRAVQSLPALDSMWADASSDLQRALIADRRHELSNDLADAQRAFDLYYDVASRDTTAAWAFYGIGRVVAVRPAVLFETPGLLDALLPPRRIAGALGLEPESRAQQAMLRALLIDPGLEAAALTVADMAVVSMDPTELEIAARALDWVTQQSDAAPEVWLALSRVRALLADVDAANAAALTAMAGGADPSLSLISAASALLASSATEERGAQAYVEGTRRLSEEGAARYYRDVEQILSVDQRSAWERMDLGTRGDFLRRFWEVRAGLSGATVARSLGDHYRMLVQAERTYGGQYGDVSPVDQMLGTGDHFPNTIRSGHSQPLDYVYDFYQFRGEQERTTVTAALAIPADQLRPMLTDSQVVYGVKAALILVDTLRESVARVDTTMYFASEQLADSDSWLRAYVNVDGDARDRTVYRLVVGDAFDPRTGALFGGPIRLRDFTGGRLEVSDIVLTGAGEGRWQRGELTLPLTPAVPFERSQPITLFYEIYNLPSEGRYRTEVRVVPVSRGLVDRVSDLLSPGTRSLRVSFEGTAPAGAAPVQEVRTLQTGLRPDAYIIEVTVTDLSSGERASARSQMTLTEAIED